MDRIHEAAFGQRAEADLVGILRRRASPSISLVAERAGEVRGHVFFSPVTVAGDASFPAGGLAPVGVLPEWQGQGAGQALVRAGLDACRTLGWQAVVVLGSPVYYARFGFELGAPRGLRYQSEAFDEHFQVLELVSGSLAGRKGFVRYHEAFDDP